MLAPSATGTWFADTAGGLNTTIKYFGAFRRRPVQLRLLGLSRYLQELCMFSGVSTIGDQSQFIF